MTATATERADAEAAAPAQPHLILIDGSGYIFRAYHALPPLTRKSDGLPVGAVAGFCNILWNELSRATSNGKAATHLAVVFDHSSTAMAPALLSWTPAFSSPMPDVLGARPVAYITQSVSNMPPSWV